MTYVDRTVESADGLSLHLRDYPGPSEGAPVVLCLHGLTRNARDFATVADSLRHRFRVLVMEQRGRGQSQHDTNAANYQLTTYVRDTAHALDALNIGPVIVLGTSMGGLMGMLMAAQPDTPVQALVLNDVGPVVEADGIARIQSYVGKGPEVSDWTDAAAAARAANESAFPEWQHDDWLAFAQNLYRENAEGRPVLDYDPAIATPLNEAPETAAPADLWPLFDQITVPMLVIRGALSDILSAATVQEMRRRKPQLLSVEVPGRGHAPMLDEPAAWSAIESFLASF